MIVVTGCSGFLGGALCQHLISDKREIRPLVRNIDMRAPSGAIPVGSIDDGSDFTPFLEGAEVVIHTAARAHMLKDFSADPLHEFRKVNTYGTINLARQAAEAGVKRFVFISSIGVNGLNSFRPFTETDSEAPHDYYSQSKLEAEIGLMQIAEGTDMEVVIIRPPLVYGANAPGNFRSLIRLVSIPVPLPFGLVNNRRSMVYLNNLVDFIVQCIDHPSAANQIFLVSDGRDLSLSNLIRSIRKAMNKHAWLLPVPVSLFKLVGKLTGKSAVVGRLVGDLQVDSGKARELLGWTPPYTVEQGIIETVKDFMNRKD